MIFTVFVRITIVPLYIHDEKVFNTVLQQRMSQRVNLLILCLYEYICTSTMYIVQYILGISADI